MTTHTINGIIIHTSYEYPPIPVRDYDWSAVTDNYDGAPDAGWQPVGRGETEQEAINDLLEQIAEHDDKPDMEPWSNIRLIWGN